VVIVNYRRYDDLERCLRSLLASTFAPDGIIVVDNAGERHRLTETIGDLPTVQAITNEENRGYAAACNQGWRATRSDMVLFLNPDVTLAPDCLDRCLAAAEADDAVGIVTCRLVRPDATLDHACHRGIPTPLAALAYRLGLHRLRPGSRRLGRYTLSWLDPHTDHDIEACSGAFLLARRDVLEAVDGWDEGYWFYAEDVDLCLRVARLGKRIRYVGTAEAVHVKGASSRLHTPASELDDAERRHRRRLERAIVESHLRFFRKHFQETTPRIVTAAILGMFAFQRLRLGLIDRVGSFRGG
jgi:GT2 family glycosyltransferase